MRSISLRTTVTLALLGILLAAAVSAGFSLWLVAQSRFLAERSRLAGEVLESHLRLAALAQSLSVAGAVDASSSGSLADMDTLRASLDSELLRIRRLNAAEVALVGAQDQGEAGELERLSRIEALVHRLSDERRAGRTVAAEDPQSAADLSRVIQEAVDDEAAEKQTADRGGRALLRRLQQMAWGLTLAVAAISLLAWRAVERGLTRPLARLVKGTEALAAGDLSHRIGTARNDELGRLAASFDRMAADLEAQRTSLEHAQQRLESDVAARTVELRGANDRLAQVDETRRRFLADVSHELRTPLTVIRGEAEVTLRGADKPAEDYQSSLRRINEQARLVQRLVEDLLFMARQDEGQARLRFGRIDLGDLLAALCDEFGALIESRGLTIRFEDDAATALFVQGDADRLRQLFMILIDNAVRYSHAGAAITVRLRRELGLARVDVEDRGIGIPAADLNKVFDRFHRAENAARHSPIGTGLGLPLAKAITEAHGGRIAIDSEEGRGTTVSVFFNAAEAEA
jgi:signal transduction histidine kinase